MPSSWTISLHTQKRVKPLNANAVCLDRLLLEAAERKENPHYPRELDRRHLFVRQPTHGSGEGVPELLAQCDVVLVPVPPGTRVHTKDDINTPQRKAKGSRGRIEPVQHACDMASLRVRVDVILGKLDVVQHGGVSVMEELKQLVPRLAHLWVEA